MKKEPSDYEDLPRPVSQARGKPRLESTKSDGHITVFQNGHHKPVHRKNHAAHECGMPYKIPRSNTAQGISSGARRSVDSLALDSSNTCSGPKLALKTNGSLITERRLSKSEQGSPQLKALDALSSYPAFGVPSGDIDSFAQQPNCQSVGQDFDFSGSDAVWDPMSGMEDATFDPWSAMPSNESINLPNNNPFTAWPTTAEGSNMAQPALTAASSGTQSEIDELPHFEDFNVEQQAMGPSALPVSGLPDIQEDNNFVNSADTDFMLDNFQSNRRSLPASFWSNMDIGSMGANAFVGSASGLGSVTYDSKPKDLAAVQSTSVNQAWQMPNMSSVSDTSAATFGGLPVMASNGRPQALYVGADGASNDEVFKKLFPDYDVNNLSSNNISNRTSGNMRGLDASTSPREAKASYDATSLDTDISATDLGMYGDDLDMGISPLQWDSNSALSTANDPFDASFNLGPDYSNPDFTPNWTQ